MSKTPRACILSISGTRLTSAEASFLGEYNPWGLILMGRSCQSPGQVRMLIESIWNALDRQCLIFIDQEGGRVQRLQPPNWPDFPPVSLYGQLFQKDSGLGREAAFLGYWLIAAELEAMGIRADCAPVLDLQIHGADAIIGDRAFSPDPLTVGDLGRAALEGLAAGGVAGVVKHIPGHGRANADSHEMLPTIMASREVLDLDLEPFMALRDAPMAMTAHIAYEAYDPGVAATVSKKVISEVIRQGIGFDGLLLSDDLGMKALGGSLSARTGETLAAGCDIALYCAGFDSSSHKILPKMREVAEACRPLSDRACERAEAAHRAVNASRLFDLDNARKRYTGLLALMETDGG